MIRFGRPEIMNTDQGSQFTVDFIKALTAADPKNPSLVAISMDGKGAWRDNVFVERLWHQVKYEEVYLRAYDSVSDPKLQRSHKGGLYGSCPSLARAGIDRYLKFYNQRRPHSALAGQTPDQAYLNQPKPLSVAA